MLCLVYELYSGAHHKGDTHALIFKIEWGRSALSYTKLSRVMHKVSEYDQEIPQSHKLQTHVRQREEEPRAIYSKKTSER